jgi:diguanylate cyclase (GGDEF)-like protein
MMDDRRVSLRPGGWAAAAIGLMVLAGMRVCAETPGRPETASELTEVSAIRSLTADQADEKRAVRVRGVVTVVSGWKSSFFFQDGTAGISINRLPANATEPEVHQGQEVEIRGVTSAGLFAPLIEATEVKVLGEGKLPVAPPVDLDRLAGGKLDGQWITIKGVVRTATVKPSWGHQVLFLDVDVGGGTLVTARMLEFPDRGWHRLPTSTVSIRGVCATTFNDKRQFIGLRLFVASLADVNVIRSSPADPFDRPMRPLSGLLRFDPTQDGITPVKVHGVVTNIQPDQGIYIQDGPDGVLVRGTQTTPVGIGMPVEAVGYPGGGDYSPSLESSTYREVPSAGQTIAPAETKAAEMIVEKDGFSGSPYDSRLVRLEGRLEQVIPGVEEHVLFLREGETVFTARLPKRTGGSGIPPVGSTIKVTGVCATRVDSGHEARSFRILMRSAADIVVLKRAPWWSANHAKPVVGALVIAILLLLAWLLVQRREGRLRQLALTDALTGLYNRRGFVLLAQHQMNSVLRKKASLLLCYIDVDDFKSINDTLGHKQGDLALQAVAGVLRDCFRKADLIARLGGDEFAVSAMDDSPTSGQLLEERLGRMMQQWNQKDGRLFDLSLSVGTLVWTGDNGAVDFKELLAKADLAMYERKRVKKAQKLVAVEATD